MSRAFTVDPGGGKGLVPIADLFNHLSAGEHAQFTEGGGGREGGGDGEEVHVMRLLRPVAAGEEIFNTYGRHSNAHLLQMYGFSYPNNPCDRVEVGMAGLRAALALEGAAPRAIALRVAWCKREGLLPDVAGGVDASFALAPRGDLPARLLRILGAIQLDDAAFDALAGDGASAGTHVGGLWGALDAALVAAGASGPASGCGGVEAGWEALATPQAARTLLRAVAMREGLYPVGATIEQQAVEAEELVAAGPPGGCGWKRGHALRVTCGERFILRAAREGLERALGVTKGGFATAGAAVGVEEEGREEDLWDCFG